MDKPSTCRLKGTHNCTPNQPRVGQESLGALNLTSLLLVPHHSVGVSSGQQLRLYAYESTTNVPALQQEQLIYAQLLIRELLSC